MYTQKERDAMSKHLSTTKLKWRRREVWAEFQKKACPENCLVTSPYSVLNLRL
jgi:hypothetical protein